MKSIKFLACLLFMTIGITSCYEDYIADYEEPSMGFAIEKPVRTVIADRDMPIYIGVAIGGKREVDMSDWAKFIIDESLLTDDSKAILPSTHYTLGDPEYMRVRYSNLPVADVSITFTEDFYNDPMSLNEYYVLPFRMTENSIGAIREEAETTMAIVKYISTFAGTYYRYGSVTEIDPETGQEIGDSEYFGDNRDLINSPTTTMTTIGPRSVKCNIAQQYASVGSIILVVDEQNNVQITGEDGKAEIGYVSGSWTKEGVHDYVANAGTKAPEFNIAYTYNTDGKSYKVLEKLILRQDPLYDLRVETW